MVEVNANTVMRSYDYLQSQEVIYNKRGIGYFVASGARALILSLRKEYFLKEEVDYFFKQMYTLGISAEDMSAMYGEFSKKQNKEEDYETNNLYNIWNVAYRIGCGVRWHILRLYASYRLG